MMSKEDIVLFNRIKVGDLGAYETLFRRYYSYLCSVAYNYLNDHDTAEEIVQELFYRIWEKRVELNITSAVKPYLVKAVYYNSVNLMAHRRKDISLDEQYYESERGNSNTEDLIELEELNLLIESCMKELPEKGRQIFSLSRFEGLKYREIAERLSVSVKTVEAYMGQALKVFRKNMGEYLES